MITFILSKPVPKPKLRNRIHVSLRGCYEHMNERFSLDDSFQVDPAEGAKGFRQVDKPKEFMMLVMCYQAMVSNELIETVPSLFRAMAKMYPGFDKYTLESDCPIETEYDILPEIHTFEACYFDNNGQLFNMTWVQTPQPPEETVMPSLSL